MFLIISFDGVSNKSTCNTQLYTDYCKLALTIDYLFIPIDGCLVEPLIGFLLMLDG